MPKLEKERPMPVVKIQTKSDDLSAALEKMTRDSDSMDFELGKNLEITIQEVIPSEQSSETVTAEQQRLLDMVDKTIMTKYDTDSTESIRAERQGMDGYDADGFREDIKAKK